MRIVEYVNLNIFLINSQLSADFKFIGSQFVCSVCVSNFMQKSNQLEKKFQKKTFSVFF